MRLYDAAGQALSQADVTLLAAGAGMHALTSLALRNVRGQSIRIRSKHSFAGVFNRGHQYHAPRRPRLLSGQYLRTEAADPQTRLLDTDRLMSDLAQTLQHRDFTLTSPHAGIRTSVFRSGYRGRACCRLTRTSHGDDGSVHGSNVRAMPRRVTR